MRATKTRTAIVALALALVPVACREPAPPGSVGSRAPAYAARTLDGDSVELGNVDGRAILVNLWATWCAPCRRETPELQALHEAYHDDGLRVIGVSVDGPGARSAIDAFLEEYGVTYDIWWDPDETATAAFGTAGLPTSYLLDGDGRIVWRRLGALNLPDSAFISTLKGLLGD